MNIFTAERMRELEAQTVERCGISYGMLMETAGQRVVEAIEQEYGTVAGKTFQVFCGKGNNGGDGAVVARLLWLRGAAQVYVYLFGRLDEMQGPARVNMETIQKISEGDFDYMSERLIFIEVNASMLGTEMIGTAIGLKLGIGGEEEEEEEDLIPDYILLDESGIDAEQEPEEEQGIFVDDEFGEDENWLAGDMGRWRPGSGVNFIIDALFGIGLTRPAKGFSARAIELMQQRFSGFPTKVVSIDIPSGLSSDSGRIIGPHVKADLTVSFTAVKIGNVMPPACYANGKIVVAGIGMPDQVDEENFEESSTLEFIESSYADLALSRTRRQSDAHKNSVGEVLLIAGSRGKTGAAALAAEAVLRAGAGLVTVATAQSALPLLVAQSLNEVMTESLVETAKGAIAHEALAHARQLASKCQAVALGPGLASSEETTRRFVREFVERRSEPLVIDADGLNALAPWPDELRGSEELPIIITPHLGEMARLTGKRKDDILNDRIGVAREFAMKHDLITVLKGPRSVIASPDGWAHVSSTGNAGMATAGAGDVLTGMLAGLLAQSRFPERYDTLNVVIAAVILHGLAGDLAAAKLGQRSLLASDIIAHIGEAILQVGGAAERGTSQTITSI
jgi:ADP-dependent NAD(P)H-hydrate dehydratase / NAD(P)H-hydrate epimerase